MDPLGRFDGIKKMESPDLLGSRRQWMAILDLAGRLLFRPLASSGGSFVALVSGGAFTGLLNSHFLTLLRRHFTWKKL